MQLTVIVCQLEGQSQGVTVSTGVRVWIQLLLQLSTAQETPHNVHLHWICETCR